MGEKEGVVVVLGRGCMEDDILLGLLCCRGLFMQMKGKRKVMVVSGLRLDGWGRAAFIGGSILWIALGFGVGCLRVGECFYV